MALKSAPWVTTNKQHDAVAVMKLGLSAIDGTLSSDLSKLTLTGEANEPSNQHYLTTALNALSPIIDNLTASMPELTSKSVEVISTAQLAAAYGALMALDPRAAAGREIVPSSVRDSMHRVITTEGQARNSLAMECLDVNCGDHMITNSIIYNMGLCGYHGLVGNLYSVMLIDPSESGFRIMAKLLYVHNGLAHDPSGILANFKRSNLIRAYADHTVLEADGILAVPVYTLASAAVFVDPAIIGTETRERKGETFQTSYIKNNAQFDLIGVSQTAGEVARGVADITYSLQRDISYSDVLVTVGADLFNFRLSGINSARFSQAPQGDAYEMVGNLGTDDISLSSATTLVDGGAPTEAAILALTAAGMTAFIRLEASARVNIHTGSTRVTGVAFRLSKVIDSLNQTVPMTNLTVAALNTLLAASVIEGWKLKAMMCPRNLSIDCLQVLNDCYVEEHYIPHTCTLTTKSYINQNSQTDVDNLVQLSRVKLENSAATHLLNTVAEIEDLYKSARLEERPDVLGVGRLYVRPSFIKKTLDMTTVSSFRAGQRREDLRSMINDSVAEIASRLYTSSDMAAARCHLRPNDSSKPVVAVITSPHIGSYIAQSGQFASVSDSFDLRLITTPDRRFDVGDSGKIVIVFTNYQSDVTEEFDPLSWGTLAQSPETVYNITRPIGRAMVQEIMVSPRFKFIAGSPIAGVITVNGLSSAALNQAVGIW